MNIKWDITDFMSKSAKVDSAILAAATKGVGQAGDELLRLSTLEVPHDEGTLQATGKVTKKDLTAAVSYNTPYAVRLHEHPEFRFQGGRKGKYLEDPFKKNAQSFKGIIAKVVKSGIK